MCNPPVTYILYESFDLWHSLIQPSQFYIDIFIYIQIWWHFNANAVFIMSLLLFYLPQASSTAVSWKFYSNHMSINIKWAYSCSFACLITLQASLFSKIGSNWNLSTSDNEMVKIKMSPRRIASEWARERENCQLFVCWYNLKKFHELPTLLRRQSIHNNKTPERENTSFIQIVPFGCGDCFFLEANIMVIYWMVHCILSRMC